MEQVSTRADGAHARAEPGARRGRALRAQPVAQAVGRVVPALGVPARLRAEPRYEGRHAAGPRAPRIALYSHDTMGIGHARRNLLLAQTLAAPPLNASVLCIAGMREVHGFPLPARVDFLTLPALYKGSNGAYRARSLPVPLEELVALRAETILAAVQAFQPDVLVVDKVARGALGELDATLVELRRRGDTRCVLGLRDVLDDPAVVRGEWRRDGTRRAIRDHYDAVWVYGDPAVYDPVREYGLPAALAARVRYTGYLDQRARLRPGAAGGADVLECLGLPPGRLALCTTGGGQDGARLAEAFLRAPMPRDMIGVVVAGPMMPAADAARLRRLAAGRPRLRVLDSLPEPGELLLHCERVVSMGGYNTTCEILSHGKRALIVPRVRPRREQQIRAERLRDLGLLDVLAPDALTPDALGAWLARELPPPPDCRSRLDLGGLDRLPGLLLELLSAPAAAAPPALDTEVKHAS